MGLLQFHSLNETGGVCVPKFPEFPGIPSSGLKEVLIEDFKTFVKEPLPEAQWLIDGLFEQDSMTILFGASGEGKTFVALSWAVAVATGMPWLGKYPALKGTVVYAVGEGSRGFTRRAAAIAKQLGLTDIPNLHFYPGSPQLRSPEGLKKFLKQIKPLQPVLVIIDTLARSMVGGDENAAKDMGEWVNAAFIIQQETGACVMPVHHTAKTRKPGSPPTERGSGALRGAVDTSIGVSMLDGIIQLTNFKQKDEGLFQPILVGTEVWVLRPAEEGKKALTTLILVPVEDTVPVSILDAPQLAVALLTKAAKPLNKTQWFELLVAEQTRRGMELTPRATFFRWPTKLVAEGQVVEHEGLYSVMRLVKGDKVA